MYPATIDIQISNRVWKSDDYPRLYFFFPQPSSIYYMKVDVNGALLDWSAKGTQLTIGNETFEIIYTNMFYVATMVLRDGSSKNRVYKESFYG